MTIVEFLQARIAEDEQVANDAIRSGSSYGEDDDGVWQVDMLAEGGDSCRIEGTRMIIYDEGGHTHEDAVHIARWDPHRALKECTAKREMIGLLRADIQDPHNLLRREWAATIVRALLAIHADHPDYQAEWA